MSTDDAPPRKVMVLAGGPDRERPVSLMSGALIAEALEQAGYDTQVRDVLPDDLSALDVAAAERRVVFPALHGPWGEGGPLQEELEKGGLCFVGSGSKAAKLAMNKHATKQRLLEAGLPTPEHQLLGPGDPLDLPTPVVLKPVAEGSSLGMAICRSLDDLEPARDRLHPDFGTLLAERFIPGRELTVSVLGGPEPDQPVTALPIIEIRSAASFYDYQAKYESEDTQYLFDLGLPDDLYQRIQSLAEQTHRLIGTRHLSRVDLILSDENELQILEINTLPGFTSHSLLPMAANRAGLEAVDLVTRLVGMAMGNPQEPLNIIQCGRDALPADRTG